MTPNYLYRLRITKLFNDIQLALTNYDPEAIHDVRVSIRRMIALNTVLRNAGKAPYSKKELRILKNKFRQAGSLRDIQIQKQLLDGWENKLQLRFDLYHKALERREKVLQCNFARAFKTINLKRTIHDKSKRNSVCMEIEEILENSYSDFHEKSSREHGLHPLRITAKKLKYALEIQQACFPGFGLTEAFRKYLAHLQDLLGTWHDLEMTIQYLNGFIKRNGSKITDPGNYDTLLALMKNEKKTVLSEVEQELGKEAPLKEQVSVVLP
jgi:CHAD domain-containing protein